MKGYNEYKTHKVKIAKYGKKSITPYKYPNETQNFLNVKPDNILKEGYNYGILCGKINDLLVVDFDTSKKDYKFEYGLDLEMLKKTTYAVKSPNGFHLYFKYDKDIVQKQDIKTDKICDVDTRSDGGYVVGNGSKRAVGKKGEKNLIMKYRSLNNLFPTKLPDELKKILLENGYGKSDDKKPINTKKNLKNKNPNNVYDMIDKSVFIPDFHLIKILDDLPDLFYNKTEFWKFASIFKYLDKYDIWNNFNKKQGKKDYKYDEINNKKIWDDVNPYKCNLNLLVNLFKNKENQGYYQLKNIIEKPIKSIKINKEKLGYDFIQPDLNYLIKSDTGTGKTTSVKHFLMKNENLKFISIVSRKSLGQAQHATFNENNDLDVEYYEYMDFWEKSYSQSNIVIQIDSLLKIHQGFDLENYVIVLDEFESMLYHLFMVETMNNKRISVFKKLIYLLQNCKNFICIDADITEKSIEFLNRFIGRNFECYENKYLHNKNVNAFEIEEAELFISQLKKEEKFLCACDSASQAELIKKEIQKDENDDIKIITSKTDEYIDFNKHNKIIYSPKVIYGIDSQLERPVYVFMKEHTINPKNMLQQIARERKITNLYFHFKQKSFKYNSTTFDDVLTTNKNVLTYGINKKDNILDTAFTLEDEILQKNYLMIYSKFEYENLCYNTNKFCHFLKLVQERGFNLQTFKKQNTPLPKKEKEPLNTEEWLELTNSRKIVEDYLGLSKWDEVLLENVEFVAQYNFFSEHYNYKNFFIDNVDSKELWEKTQDKDDFMVNKIKSNNEKIRFLREFKKMTNNTDPYELSCKKIMNKEQINKFEFEYKAIFNQKYYDLKFKYDTLYDLNKIQAKMYKTIFGNKSVDAKRKSVDGEKIYEYNFNDNDLQIHKKLVDRKKEKEEVFEVGKCLLVDTDSEDEN
tara:strand:+ start:1543 stop:4287 length:2745 start_codon:yes stop_codon:yes gene_type:complete